MRKGVLDIERLSKHAKIIDTCVYQGKRYALYIDYTDTLILVSITDMWYIYIDEFIFDYDYIPDDLFYKLGGILIW
jgi:hypothetical protein|nr:MAG TPA: hypothetical protein [Caudoviricetes sp.]